MLTIGVTVGLCLVGCVFTVPVVLMITNIRGWRFWFYWALGSSYGPLLMLALCALVFFLVPHGPNDRWFRPELLPLVYLAAAVSSLTSLFYLLLLRRAQDRAARKTAGAPMS
jgi:integral membrane sensor domain MASE1